MGRKKKKKSRRKVRLKPADSFDLIRLLARSQHDPKKAIGELVQNSLDAQAHKVEITWFNEAGVRAIRILDDGEGVFPTLPREEALRKIASTIGHSHKRSLNPSERRELMLLGQYGIGLLGFWSVGHIMEIRSRVDGGEVWCLRLVEDSPHADILKVPLRRLALERSFTEITIHGVHAGARRQIRPSRLHLYLSGELRGQLLRRETAITIRDRVARGRARKFFTVEPQRYRGRRLADLSSLTVPGYEDAELELYLLAPEDERDGRVSLACGGTTVIDDIATIDGSDRSRSPWDSGRIEGVIEFSELKVAPGTRRGFQLTDAAVAFVDALGDLESQLRELIAEDDREHQEQRDQKLARQIRNAFVSVAVALPEYDLFDVRAGGDDSERATNSEGSPLDTEDVSAEGSQKDEDDALSADDAEDDEAQELFPPGPLAQLRIRPRRCRIPPGSKRRFEVRPLDAHGRRIRTEVRYTWELDGPGLLEPEGAQAVYVAPESSATATVVVIAREAPGAEAEARAEVEVVEKLLGREKVSGIPEPSPVHAPLEPWRSRQRNGKWEFNTGHRDYVTACATESRRLRYLIHLFAKEIVLRNFGQPADEPSLERMVEVLTHLSAT